MRLDGRSIVFGLLLFAAAATAEAVTPLLPEQGGVVVPVGSGSDMKDYLLIGVEGVEFHLSGPGDLAGWARGHFDEDEDGAKARRLIFAGVPGIAGADTFEFKPSSSSEYGDDKAGRPSGGRKVSPRRLPAGSYTLRLRAPDGPVMVRLDWEPEFVEGGIQPAGAAAKPREKSPWKTSATVGLETIYDDNFLRYSDDYLDQFYSGAYPYKFQIERKDSHILAPSISVYAQRKFWDAGNTRFSFKFKTWQYVQGSIKSNMSFDYSVRQFFSGGKSLEFGYAYAPEQYIRELSDRSPLVPPSDPLVWEEFRYTRNVFDLTWRQPLHKDLDLRLAGTRSLRYYNQPFMENDIKDLGLRATLVWDAHRDWRLTFDYGYTDAPARGADEVGETIENSNDSDPSFNRDLYQVDATWSPRWAEPFFEKVGLRGQYQVYWFTSAKELLDDPYHVGRIDRMKMIQLTFDRTLPGDVDMEIGVRYTVRTVESPWEGDIAEDKDFNQRRYWIGLTYKL